MAENKKVFKVECCYFIEASDIEEAKDQVVMEVVEGEFFDAHILVTHATNDDLENIQIGKEEIYITQ